MLGLRKPISFLHTLWLFTYSDLKTMVFPSTAFAFLVGLAELLSVSKSDPQKNIKDLIQRIPFALFWSWINLLAFNVNNQKLPHAIEQDKLNKPWRPLPSKRLTPSQASFLARVAYPTALIASWIVGGGMIPSLLLASFGYAYNDLQYAEGSIIGRNVLNAFGFISFAGGALQVALQSPISRDVAMWLGLIALLISSTVHIQDLSDQVGDSATGRLTIPLLFGDRFARYSVAILVIIWSYLCPTYWGVNSLGFATVGLVGVVIVARLLLVRTIQGDKTTFLIYNGWLVCVYTLPLIAYGDGTSETTKA